jgi:hypothetical protein
MSQLIASYVLKADSIKLGDLFPSRPGSGVISQLVVNGTADGELASPRLSARVLSSDGSLEHVDPQSNQHVQEINSVTRRRGI